MLKNGILTQKLLYRLVRPIQVKGETASVGIVTTVTYIGQAQSAAQLKEPARLANHTACMQDSSHRLEWTLRVEIKMQEEDCEITFKFKMANLSSFLPSSLAT